MIKYVLWDVDGTLLNFHLAEENAIRACFDEYGLGDLSEEGLNDYRKINNKYWKALEKGKIRRIEVLEGRFREFFQKYGYDTSIVSDFNISFQENLGKTYVFNNKAYETVNKLGEKYKQYAATNGSSIAQEGKLKGAGLESIFEDVFISERIGYEKPSKKFFDYIFNTIGSRDTSEYLIIGDSLTSDIRGGRNAGIKTVWFNPDKEEKDKDIDFDYEVNNLEEVLDIL